MGMQPPKAILFVCTGNICRSPTAEGVMREALAEAGRSIHLDSAGIESYHVGEAPDRRSQGMAKAFGVDLSAQRARKVTPGDYLAFDLILAMDEGHLRTLKRLAPKGATAELALYLPYAGIDTPRDMPDPYYGQEADFHNVIDLCQRATALMLEHWHGI